MTAEEFRFTDDQWRAYQALPDQGYSHRHWLEHTFNSWLAARPVEDTEWEYAWDAPDARYPQRTNKSEAEWYAVKRTKAGPWLPVPPTIEGEAP